MILIEECLRNFEELEALHITGVSSLNSFELSDLYVDITMAMEKVEFTLDEIRVLILITQGYNYSEIARETSINRLAVPNHFAKICIKLSEELGQEYYTKLGEK